VGGGRPAHPFDLRRFNAIRGYQAQQGREIGRCLKKLRQLRKDALLVGTDAPELATENEPKSPPPTANDDTCVPQPAAMFTTPSAPNEPESPSTARAVRHEPEPGPSADIGWLRQQILAELAARAEQDDRDPARLEDLSRRLYLAHTGQALPA
jgi:hypothetical protein